MPCVAHARRGSHRCWSQRCQHPRQAHPAKFSDLHQPPPDERCPGAQADKHAVARPELAASEAVDMAPLPTTALPPPTSDKRRQLLRRPCSSCWGRSPRARGTAPSWPILAATRPHGRARGERRSRHNRTAPTTCWSTLPSRRFEGPGFRCRCGSLLSLSTTCLIVPASHTEPSSAGCALAAQPIGGPLSLLPSLASVRGARPGGLLLQGARPAGRRGAADGPGVARRRGRGGLEALQRAHDQALRQTNRQSVHSAPRGRAGGQGQQGQAG